MRILTLLKNDNAQRGVSLIELLVVLTIFSISSVAAFNLIHGASSSIQLKSTQAQLVSDLKNERQKALLKGIISKISFDQSGYRLERSNIQRTWPKGVTFKSLSKNDSVLYFFEDGSSSGGAVTLFKGSHAMLVSVNSLTGAVSYGA